MESTLRRGNDIVLGSEPFNFKKIVYKEETLGPSFYERELNYLQNNSIKFGFNYFAFDY